ncbi:hypothetical protein ACFLQG_00305 [Candidatus Zixiibacteriota bacterium]
MNLIKKNSFVILIIIFIITNINAQNEVTYHPDGILGSLSFHANFKYYSVSKDPQYSFVDVEQFAAKLNWVSNSRMSVSAQAIVIKEDSTHYRFGGGIKYYLKNPINSYQNKNHDGTIGFPIISIDGFISKSSENTEESKLLGIAKLIFPLSKTITFSGGYQYYDELNAFNLRDKFLSIKYYFSYSNPTQMYLNPDGPIGNLVMELSGGASSKGEYGDLSLLFPLNPTLTLFSEMTYEQTEFQNKKSYGIGLGFSYYPSR